MTNKIIRDVIDDSERAFYNLKNKTLINCSFKGDADGESALKESRNIKVIDSEFHLRYPLWHTQRFSLDNVFMADTCRAPLWYSKNGVIKNSNITGVKALRESKNIEILDSNIESTEFFWKCSNIRIKNSKIVGEYPFLESKNIELDNIELSGKYSFQYVSKLSISNSKLYTKDSFWHAKDVLVKDSYIKAEYIGWYSDNLTFINCVIEGIQPFCYAKNLKLINCKMINANLSFEYSSVDADIVGHIDSIKNPLKGRIIADSIGEIIKDNPVYECNATILIRK